MFDYSEINASSNALTKSIITYLNLRGFNVWRNNTGKGYGLSQISAIKAGAKPRPIEFGKPDSPDIIGYDPNGVFVGLEIKAVSKKRTDGQTEFVNHAAKAGAFCHFIETFEGFLEVFNARYNYKISNDNYSISEIRRKSDGKIFVCFYRNGSVKTKSDDSEFNNKHWFIGKNDSHVKEQICLLNIDTEIYDIINIVED